MSNAVVRYLRTQLQPIIDTVSPDLRRMNIKEIQIKINVSKCRPPENTAYGSTRAHVCCLVPIVTGVCNDGSVMNMMDEAIGSEESKLCVRLVHDISESLMEDSKSLLILAYGDDTIQIPV